MGRMSPIRGLSGPLSIVTAEEEVSRRYLLTFIHSSVRTSLDICILRWEVISKAATISHAFGSENLSIYFYIQRIRSVPK